MPFRKNNQYRIKSSGRPLDEHPICFKGWEGQKEKLKNIPDWQNQLRVFIQSYI